MKKVFFLPVIFAVILSLSGCEKDESLDPRPLLVQGQFMRLDIDSTRKKINFDNIATSSFGGMLTNPSNDVVEYDLLVRLQRPADPALNEPGFNSEYIPFETLTAFPQELVVTAQKVIDAYALRGIPVTIKDGDELKFIAYSYNSQGVEVGFRDLSAVVRSEDSYKQAYKFNTTVVNALAYDDDYSNYQN
jgi:hypothetical protein